MQKVRYAKPVFNAKVFSIQAFLYDTEAGVQEVVKIVRSPLTLPANALMQGLSIQSSIARRLN